MNSREVIVKMAYTGTDFTRQYTFSNISTSKTNQNIKDGIIGINASLAADTADGLENFFIADDFDGTNGKLKSITAATIKETTETYIEGVGE